MLKAILVSLFCAVLVTGYAQNPCGFSLDEKMRQQLLNYHANKGIPRASKSTLYEIPVQFHIVGNDNGQSYYSYNQLMNDLCELNEKFRPVGFYFYLGGDVKYINSTRYYNHDYNGGYDMMEENNVDGRVNIYMVGDPAGNCGYFSPFRDGVAIRNSCSGRGATTMTHELGHFFSLPHPFDQVIGVEEYVDGSNCSEGGDMFCDTRADYLGYRWQCPYNGSEKDSKGDAYDPDGSIYMSYSNDACQNHFTPEQIDAMHYNILGQRSELPTAAVDTTPLSKSKVLSPVNNEVSGEEVTLRWRKVSGAEGYILQVTYLTVFPNVLTVDTYVKDTSFTKTIAAGRTYRWRVRPIKKGYTCAEFSDTGIFRVEQISGINIVGNEIKVFPNPVRSSETLHMSFETAGPRKFSLYNIAGQKVMETSLEEAKAAVNISGIPAGAYLVKVEDLQQVMEVKLLVTE